MLLVKCHVFFFFGTSKRKCWYRSGLKLLKRTAMNEIAGCLLRYIRIPRQLCPILSVTGGTYSTNIPSVSRDSSYCHLCTDTDLEVSGNLCYGQFTATREGVKLVNCFMLANDESMVSTPCYYTYDYFVPCFVDSSLSSYLRSIWAKS